MQPYSPYWDSDTNSFIFSDFFDATRTVNRYDMSENRYYSAAIEGNISTTFALPIQKQVNRFAFSDKLTLKIGEWDGKSSIVRLIRDTFSVQTGSQFQSYFYNMAQVSPKGNIYGGTFSAQLCSIKDPNAVVYRYSKCLGAKAVITNAIVAAGMDWYIEAKKFYFIDTCHYRIIEYDWEPKTEDISKMIKINAIHAMKFREAFFYFRQWTCCV